MKKYAATLVAGLSLALPLMSAPTGSAGAELPATALSAQQRAYVPKAGPVFSQPDDNRIHNLIVANINHAPAGSLIRAASAISDDGMTAAIRAAYRRGVQVRLVMPGNTDRGCESPESRDVRDVLGEDLRRSSWVKCIQGSARNPPGNGGHMHMKVWSFSSTGGRSNVMLVTSQNATGGRAVQFNNGYQSIGFTNLDNAWDTLFAQLRNDNGGGLAEWTWAQSGAYATPVLPGQSDPVYRRLRALPANESTRITVAMSLFSRESAPGQRPMRLAAELVRLKRAGADVRVVYTQIAGPVPPAVVLMRQGRVRVDNFTNRSSDDTCYLHSKTMTATYVAEGARRYRVWTGSEEWKQDSFGQDEFVLQLGSRASYEPFLANFNELLSRAAYDRVGLQDTCRHG